VKWRVEFRRRRGSALYRYMYTAVGCKLIPQIHCIIFVISDSKIGQSRRLGIIDNDADVKSGGRAAAAYGQR
jgi:hypothetical protein